MHTLFLLALAGCAPDDGTDASNTALAAPFDAELSDNRVADADCTFLVPEDTVTVQAAIDRAESGDTICLLAGTYRENLDLHGLSLNLVGDGRDTTFLEGNRDAPVVFLKDGDSVGSMLTDLTIRNGRGSLGGGVQVENATLTLERVSVVKNHAAVHGGGIYGKGAALYLNDVRVNGNVAAGSGGGLMLLQSTLQAGLLELNYNLAEGWGGGGIYAQDAELTIGNGRIVGNRLPYAGGAGTGGGGGIFGSRIGGDIWNTVIAGNSNTGRGGGIYFADAADVDFLNVVFAGNRALNGGAAFLLYPGVSVNFTNAVVFQNVATDQVGGVWLYGGAKAFFSWSDLKNNGENVRGVPPVVGSNGNISVVPGFVSFSARAAPNTWDFRLQPGSPLVDAGDPNQFDTDGTRSDIGAFGGGGMPVADGG